MIKVTNIDLNALAKKVYELSKPQGFGFLQPFNTPLTDNEINSMKREYVGGETCILSMDYVNGRACKFHVFQDANGDRWISDAWYDHTDEQFDTLLDYIEITRTTSVPHGHSCNCDDCQIKRGGK